MKERPLIPAEQQVAHLAERGVRFGIMSPKDAVAFLRDKNFFFKVKAFAKSLILIFIATDSGLSATRCAES